MSDMNADTIFGVARQFDLKMPAEVTEAEQILEAAEKLRASIASEQPPDYASATVKTLAKLHAAGVDHERRDERLKVADVIVSAAQSRLDQATFSTAGRLKEPLAALFADHAGAFNRALTDLGGRVDPVAASTDPIRAQALRRLTDASTALDTLQSARDAYAFTGYRTKATFSEQFEALSRCLVVPSMEVWSRHPRHEGWVSAVEHGFVIRWQSPDEQAANSEAVLHTARQMAGVVR